MSRATPKMRDFAARVLAHEAKGIKPSEANAPGVFRACEKLRPHLSTLAGSTGFRTLLSRALALAEAEVPWLRTVKVRADGSLAGLIDLGKQVDPEEIAEGSVVLLAQLLELLAAFIGENLTQQLILEVWPKLPLRDFELKGDTK